MLTKNALNYTGFVNLPFLIVALSGKIVRENVVVL